LSIRNANPVIEWRIPNGMSMKSIESKQNWATNITVSIWERLSVK